MRLTDFRYISLLSVLALVGCAETQQKQQKQQNTTVMVMEFEQDTSDARALGSLADPHDLTSMIEVDPNPGVGGATVDSYGGTVLMATMVPPVSTAPVPYASSDSYGIYYSPNSRPVGT